ncbi:sugar phosphate isomerase/epimerase [Rhizobium leguminosarum bv. viciae]|uniref:sugar phosphate isomerase/epimerase family protein n=1 Tax=Rhizobium leguminosarum TaxID=384 RepID=UPI0003657E74|nr:sugar phosphate isomerase/epimerase [Rhizobium leguminosarum bv. viciae]MBY5768878.1 sugar phosphate isomerase/epimerase [Rhizobium leguminosarum]MBY5823934.1 sugar phosphate isomerase/epimerase [Rhizobium leguminosarum]NKM99969.1 TIM barrel protein [Rhizobium leguminosarum bv. viciae]TBY77113.1 sugar phosphate isomerase/epimerase [Rhizobium leguminosarum bv. viciae]
METREETMPAKISVPTLGVAHFSAIDVEPAKFVSMAAAAGFSSVGLRLHPAFPGAPYYELPAGSDVARDVKARLNGEGIALYDIEFVVIGPDFDPDALISMLAGASALGARRLSVCGDDPDRGRLVANFAALCDLAASFGMGVDLENMGWRAVASFDDSLSIVQESERGNAGALVDALHFFRNGGQAKDVSAAPKGMIRSIQLCDARGPAPTTADQKVSEARTGRFAPGLGELPVASLMRVLPTGAAVSVEVPIHSRQAPEEHLRHLHDAARALTG